MAASATFALKAGVWFRRRRLFMVSPDSRGTACPPSGRNSTYRPVQILEAGSFIVEYKGRKGTKEQADILEARGNRYLYEINTRWTIDGTSRKNLGRYANHSCRPNAETHTIGHKVIIRAIKNIRTGAEITYSYGRDYLTNVITRRGCKCEKCR